MPESHAVIVLDIEKINEALKRSKPKIVDDDYEVFRMLTESYVELQRLFRQRGTTIARIRRLFGISSSSEKTADVLASTEDEDSSPQDEPGATAPEISDGDSTEDDAAGKADDADTEEDRTSEDSKKKGHGRMASSEYESATRIAVPHSTLEPGDRCPDCCRGNVHRRKKPITIVRIKGQPALSATCWDCESLRCGTCGKVFTAEAPKEARGPKYSETAVSMLALVHYGFGMPLNRLDELQKSLETPLPSSTQWDIINESTPLVRPAFEELQRKAAQGKTIYSDDTYMRVLEFMGKRRAKLLANGELPNPERTGLFTTGIVSEGAEEHPIVLFTTGRAHAGENLDLLLDLRAMGLDIPIHMSDALSRNAPSRHEVEPANCNSHGRRGIVDQVENFPDECKELLEMFREVFRNDATARKLGMSDTDRLRFHQSESGPVMAKLKKWLNTEIRGKRIEPNSGLGEAIRYLKKHWRKLTLFLRLEGAPLTNNIAERALKMAIRYRRNSMFYRSVRGAEVGDMYMSLIYTARLHGENPFDYLTELQRNARAVAANPADWMPWNYTDTLARLTARDAEAA